MRRVLARIPCIVEFSQLLVASWLPGRHSMSSKAEIEREESKVYVRLLFSTDAIYALFLEKDSLSTHTECTTTIEFLSWMTE